MGQTTPADGVLLRVRHGTYLAREAANVAAGEAGGADEPANGERAQVHALDEVDDARHEAANSCRKAAYGQREATDAPRQAAKHA
jgi:hypothetical protein